MPGSTKSKIAAKGLPEMKVVPDGPVVEVDSTLGPKKTTFSRYFNVNKIGPTE
jgi:hypothetical protein